MNQKKQTIDRRIPLVTLSLLGVWLLVVATHETWSVYTAQAVSDENALHGGSIDIAVEAAKANPTGSVALVQGETVGLAGTVTNEGRNTLRYQGMIALADDNPAICAALQLVAKRADSVVYTGGLSGFGSALGSLLLPDEDEAWQFDITLPTDTELEPAQSCGLQSRFPAWQGEYLAPGLGWDDADQLQDLTLVLTPVGAEEKVLDTPRGDESPVSNLTSSPHAALPALVETEPTVTPDLPVAPEEVAEPNMETPAVPDEPVVAETEGEEASPPEPTPSTTESTESTQSLE